MSPKTLFRRLHSLLLLGALLVPAPWAGAAQLRADAPDSYVVQPGDTLWSISARYLDDPWRWREVWRGNRATDPNPNLIFPGDVLKLNRGANPSIGVERGGESTLGYRGGMRVVKLSPRVRTEQIEQPIPTIPISSIAPFLTQPYVAAEGELDRAPYVVGYPEEHIVAGVGDSFYVRRIDGTAHPRFQILRPGGPYVDPETNETLGYEAIFVANAQLERPGDPAKLLVVRAEREVGIGDRAIPAEVEEPLRNFELRSAPPGMRGHIVAVLNGVSQIGRFDVVVLNRGSRDRVERGNVFEVLSGGTKEVDQVRTRGTGEDWRNEGFFSKDLWLGPSAEIRAFRNSPPDSSEPLPPTAELRYPRGTYLKPFERAGVLMVFRTFERVSFALVLEAVRAMHVDDRVAAPPP
jgi:hypothetical protein